MSVSPARRAFTLLELIVVLGILALLLGLTLAAVHKVREAGQRAACQSRLRNQAVAVLGYESAHGRLPPGAIQGPFPAAGVPDGASHSLWAVVLADLDQAPLAAQYRFDVSFDHPANRPVVTARLAVLECPGANPAAGTDGVADYAPFDVNPFLADIGLIDPVAKFDGPLPVNGRVRLADITDGAANTVLLAEAGGRPGMAWGSPEIPLSIRQFFGSHRGGSNAAMADGSVHFIRDGLGLRGVGRLATRSGGEPLDGDEF